MMESVKKCGWIIVIIAILVSMCGVLDYFRVGYNERVPILTWHEVEFERTVMVSAEIPEKQFNSPLIIEICIGECCIRNGTSAWHCNIAYINRPSLTQAFCDSDLETCSTRYKKLIMIDSLYKTYEPLEGFQCVEWETIEEIDTNSGCMNGVAGEKEWEFCIEGNLTRKVCTLSAISVNGSCRDAIAIYGGVCGG